MVTRKEKVKFIILRTVGNFFLLFSIFGMVMTFGPAIYFEIIYRTNHVRNVKYVVSVPPTENTSTISITPTPTVNTNRSFFGQITGGDKIEVISPVSAQFGIVIPKIGANAKINPNVDAGKQDEYLAALKDGVAHAAGTVFPGVTGNIYLFAHSTDAFWNVGRYNAVFYLLKELENGDEIDVFFQGVRHVYRVVNKLVVDPSETHYLTQMLPYEQLTLQTCWPPGTTFKRLLILARPERDLLVR
ncbi:hypothetical protein COV53_02800 [Candidatus Gottesmanbacteria bacterium CG11_big_fil_rev_8_21_14_0_20_37_11]|uniref:Sortase n=2 Tax=Candidatus Gottesmaniibacteriota TaxID=1752720 RepID=A0A2M7RPK4_9BACT|nr:MAG: hypothetical protein COX23_05465 [Candidatus Gottesmanbacteria bacterium CG23_combo_of_CG06-09_8_20_14_all_37_19]PIR08481.1 MAG: hypothetical protein COV53_02800 [Candidatus Gottesmanbacteria bacterium CG11_big_fil_rev_8_21_14_0_20_37_11]PIZ02243.1 MAG: hypothetical protein COY59_05840 [Candidatus Gottesmanbacteria bacterium CG_4_10_14_0_8_um_filter_37_24]